MSKRLQILSTLVNITPYAMILLISHIFTHVFFIVMPMRKKLAVKNISLAYPNLPLKEKKEMAYNGVYNLILTIFEVLGSDKLIKKINYTIINEDYLKKIHLNRKGCYMICVHQSNWEFLAYIGSSIAGKAWVPVKNIGGKKLNDWIIKTRAKYNLMTIPKIENQKTSQAIIDLLKKRQTVALIMDQHRYKGVLSTFFNTPAKTNHSILNIWEEYKAPIIPASIKRVGKLKFEVTIHDEIVITPRENKSDDEFYSININTINSKLEEIIRSSPHEYLWTHNRWKFNEAEINNSSFSELSRGKKISQQM